MNVVIIYSQDPTEDMNMCKFLFIAGVNSQFNIWKEHVEIMEKIAL
jgi:hypothetical protein